MTHLFERFLGPKSPHPVSLQELHRRRAQIDKDKAESSAKKKQDADSARIKSQAQRAHRQEEKAGVEARLQHLWDNYAQTPASQVAEDAYRTLASFPLEKGDDHPNNLERVQIEDAKDGKWVGERIQWEWYVDRWAFFKSPHTQGHLRPGGNFKIHWEDILVSRSYKGKSVSLRYFEDGHIEVIGSKVAIIHTGGRNREDIIRDLDTALGKAIRKPRFD